MRLKYRVRHPKKRHNTVTGCTLARLTPMSVNTGARKYFDQSNQLVQREQLGAMNFIFFTLFYRLNHPQRAMTQEATSAPLAMGISAKLKATFDIGLFGRIWVMDYWLTDVDVPDVDPLGKSYKVPIAFNYCQTCLKWTFDCIFFKDTI